MPNPATTVNEYCGLLVRSKLIPEAEVAALRQRWGGADAEVEAFRRHLVRKGCLTEYQATLIQRGHAGGFFVGGYTILDRIGKGQTAGVYKAVHASGQVVALKVLPASRAKDANLRGRFEREGRLLTQLDHPNVVRAFQVGRAGSIHYIVMEHLEGEPLDEVLARRKKLPVAEAARLVYQALLGLQHLHEKHMIHRDLKPANLMVAPATAPGQPDNTLAATVKILDVGIGRELFNEAADEPRDPFLTREGAILGTPDFLAPEQARDARTADIRADIYSLGCVLFALAAGQPPFPDKTVMALMVKHATEAPPPLATVIAGVPPGLQAVFDRMTAKQPGERYATPAEAAEALRAFLPPDGRSGSAPPLLPNYRQWLETGTSTEMPAELKPPAGGTAKAAPVAAPVAPPAVDEINVELVEPPAAAPEEERSLLDPSRRDFVMLGFGAAGVLAAIGFGYGLAQLARAIVGHDPAETQPGEK
jgi:serine/threonine protein kinase